MGPLRVCCTASAAPLSPPVIRVRRARTKQGGESCGGSPFWARSWPFTSCSCRDRLSRSSAAYTHSESTTCYALGTRRPLYAGLRESAQRPDVRALASVLLSVSRADACTFVGSSWRIVCLLITTQPSHPYIINHKKSISFLLQVHDLRSLVIFPALCKILGFHWCQISLKNLRWRQLLKVFLCNINIASYILLLITIKLPQNQHIATPKH